MISLQNVRYLFSETDPRRLIPALGEICFVGRSNVGKSSLLNALCHRSMARVSRTPGRTRMINVFGVGDHRWLVDLPGYGYAQVSKTERQKWGPMIEGYLQNRPNLRMVFCLVDAKIGPTALDIQMNDWLVSLGIPWRIVATKTDQVSSSQKSLQRRRVAEPFDLDPEKVAWVSSRQGTGLTELRAEVTAFLRKGDESPEREKNKGEFPGLS